MERHSHYFYAIRLPEELKEQVRTYSIELKEQLPFSRWVHHQDYHITLAFLGAAAKEKLDLSKNLVRQHLSEIGNFQLTIDSLGVFGGSESPRIFWVGVEKETGLHTVRNQVFQGCEQAGFPLESRPFHPHITLARKWQGEKPFSEKKFEEAKSIIKPISFLANEVVLYQTHLDRNPKYEAIEVFTLRNLC